MSKDIVAPHGMATKVIRPIAQPDGRIKSTNTAGGLIRPSAHDRAAQGTAAPKQYKGL
jgi:hypothetical protein